MNMVWQPSQKLGGKFTQQTRVAGSVRSRSQKCANLIQGLQNVYVLIDMTLHIAVRHLSKLSILNREMPDGMRYHRIKRRELLIPTSHVFQTV